MADLSNATVQTEMKAKNSEDSANFTQASIDTSEIPAHVAETEGDYSTRDRTENITNNFFHASEIKGLQQSQFTVDEDIYSFNKFTPEDDGSWESYLICLEEVPGVHLDRLKSKTIEPHLYNRLSDFVKVHSNVNIHLKNNKVYFYLQCDKAYVEGIRNLSLQWIRREDDDKELSNYSVSLHTPETITEKLRIMLHEHVTVAKSKVIRKSLKKAIVSYNTVMGHYCKNGRQIAVTEVSRVRWIIRILVKLLLLSQTKEQIEVMLQPLRTYLEYAETQLSLDPKEFKKPDVRSYLYYVYIWNCISQPHFPKSLDDLLEMDHQHLKTFYGYYYNFEEFFTDPETLCSKGTIQRWSDFSAKTNCSRNNNTESTTVQETLEYDVLGIPISKPVDPTLKPSKKTKGRKNIDDDIYLQEISKVGFSEIEGIQLSEIIMDQELYSLNKCDPQDEYSFSSLFESYLICLDEVPGVCLKDLTSRSIYQSFFESLAEYIADCQMNVNVHLKNGKKYFFLKCEKSLCNSIKHLSLQWFRYNKHLYSLLEPNRTSIMPKLRLIIEKSNTLPSLSKCTSSANNTKVMLKFLNMTVGKGDIFSNLRRFRYKILESETETLLSPHKLGLEKTGEELFKINRYLYLVYIINCLIQPQLPLSVQEVKANPQYLKYQLGYFKTFKEFVSSSSQFQSKVKIALCQKRIRRLTKGAPSTSVAIVSDEPVLSVAVNAEIEQINSQINCLKSSLENQACSAYRPNPATLTTDAQMLATSTSLKRPSTRGISPETDFSSLDDVPVKKFRSNSSMPLVESSQLPAVDDQASHIVPNTDSSRDFDPPPSLLQIDVPSPDTVQSSNNQFFGRRKNNFQFSGLQSHHPPSLLHVPTPNYTQPDNTHSYSGHGVGSSYIDSRSNFDHPPSLPQRNVPPPNFAVPNNSQFFGRHETGYSNNSWIQYHQPPSLHRMPPPNFIRPNHPPFFGQRGWRRR